MTKPKNTKTRKDALDKILQAPFRLKRRGKPAVKAVLLDGTQHLALIYQSGSEGGYDIYDVGVPDRELSKAVWDLIDDQLRQQRQHTPKSPCIRGVLSEVVAKLLSPPYGLYRPVLLLFVAAFYRMNRDYIEIYKLEEQTRPIHITSKEILDLVENPNQYMIRYQPLTTGQSQFLQGLEQALPLAYHQPGLLANRVAQSLRRWARQEVSLVARKASPDELALVFSDVLYETLTAGALLMDAARFASPAETATALLESVPTRLGLADDPSQWTESTLKPVLLTLQKACQQLQDFSAHFKAQLAWQIGQRFGLTIRSAKLDQTLKRALQWRQEQQLVKANDDSLNPDAKSLLQALDQNPTNFEQLFLNDLLSQWRLKRFDEWQGIGAYNAYLERLGQAVAAIEARASELAAEQACPEARGEAILVQRRQKTSPQVRRTSQPSAHPSQKEAQTLVPRHEGTISLPSTPQHSSKPTPIPSLLSKLTSTAPPLRNGEGASGRVGETSPPRPYSEVGLAPSPTRLGGKGASLKNIRFRVQTPLWLKKKSLLKPAIMK